jgi:hypothetical protein
MEFHTVECEGSPRGYFLLAHAPGQCRIADFYVDSDDPADLRILLQLAVREAARHPEATEVITIASDPLAAQALVACGFHPRGASEIRVLPSKGVAIPDQPVRFQMIDNDAAWLHAGRTASWL